MTPSVLLDVSAVPERLTGAGRYAWSLVRHLPALDLDLSLLTRRDDVDRWRELAPRARIVARVPRSRALRLVHARLSAGRLVDRLDVDLFHGPHYTLPAGLRTPAVVTIHDMTFFDHPEWHERAKVAFFRRAITDAVRRARAIVAVSETTAERLGAILRPAAPVVTIPHGIDTDRFRPDPSPEDAAALNRLAVEEPYVLFLGVVEPRKGVPGLVRAFDRLADGHPELGLVVAGLPGWGSAEADMARVVRERRLNGRVRRIAWVPEDALVPLIRRAAAVAYPSRAEGFGLPVLEALACGTPVITVRGTAMARVVGDAAILVAADDEDQLARALETCVRGGDGERRARGLNIARAHSWERTAERHLEAYRLAASRP